MTTWEDLIISLPAVVAPTRQPTSSPASPALDEVGTHGWEAVATTVLDAGAVAVLLTRPTGDET